MRQSTWTLVLPLTIISFTIFTKCWHVEIDGNAEILKGFPLPFACPGWFTSLSLQLFVFELIVDILVYFLFWLMVTLVVRKTLKYFSIPKPVTIALLSIAGLFAVMLMLFAINQDNIYTTTRPFAIDIIKTGYCFIWE